MFLCVCNNSKKETTEKSQQERINNILITFEKKAKRYEEPANASIRQVMDAMGNSYDSLKTKDLSRLKNLAEHAEQTCIAASQGFRDFATSLPKSLPDTIKYSLTAVSALLHDAYLGRADAMNSAVHLFSDSLAIHISDISQKLKMATELSDQAVYGFSVVKQNWYRVTEKEHK